MKNFKQGDLTITVNTTGSTVTMTWLGQSDFREPADILTPYLDHIVKDIKGKKLAVHYESLGFLNSSTVKVILQFISKLNTAGVETVITYDAEVQWQRVSFKALATFCRRMNFVTVQQVGGREA